MEFAFRGQYENCSNDNKCGSILNWLGVEAYPVYDNLPISEDDKKDPTKLLDVFECYFKLERNIFQSWYTLGYIQWCIQNPVQILSQTQQCGQ